MLRLLWLSPGLCRWVSKHFKIRWSTEELLSLVYTNMSSRLCFSHYLTFRTKWPLDNSVISRTGTILFSAKYTFAMVRGLSSVMVFARSVLMDIICITCITFALRKKNSVETIYAGAKFSVCEWKSSAVYRVILASRQNVSWNQYWDTHLRQKQRNYRRLVMNGNTAGVLKFVFVAGKCNELFLFVSFKW